MSNPTGWGQANKARLNAALDTADLALRPFGSVRGELEKGLASDDAMQRLWALNACTSWGEAARPLVPLAKKRVNDAEPLVRLRAIEFLGALGTIQPQASLVPLVNDAADPIFATEALNSVVWFRDFLGKPVERSAFTRSMNGGDVDDRLNYINGVPYPPKKWKKKK